MGFIQTAAAPEKAIKEKDFKDIASIIAKADGNITAGEVKQVALAVVRYLWAHRKELKTCLKSGG